MSMSATTTRLKILTRPTSTRTWTISISGASAITKDKYLRLASLSPRTTTNFQDGANVSTPKISSRASPPQLQSLPPQRTPPTYFVRSQLECLVHPRKPGTKTRSNASSSISSKTRKQKKKLSGEMACHEPSSRTQCRLDRQRLPCK